STHELHAAAAEAERISFDGRVPAAGPARAALPHSIGDLLEDAVQRRIPGGSAVAAARLRVPGRNPAAHRPAAHRGADDDRRSWPRRHEHAPAGVLHAELLKRVSPHTTGPGARTDRLA